jgi:osmotically-inducible protein OsmY
LSDLALRGRIIEALAGAPHVDVAEIAVECHDDRDVEAAVLDALILDDAVPAYGIDVDVEGGGVTLRGAVDSCSQREDAERIALRVLGVSQVRNRLKVW